MKIKFKKLHPDAVKPFKAHKTDAGFDLTSTWVEEDRKRQIVTYHTDIAVAIPEGFVGLLFPRSSVYKHQLQLANSVGVIDADYHGEIQLKFRIVQPHVSRYSFGERVGQLVIVPIPEVEFEEMEELDQSERGEGGFGSSGK